MTLTLLAKKKVFGKDGLPIEFFLALWKEISPVLLMMLEDGIAKGVLHP